MDETNELPTLPSASNATSPPPNLNRAAADPPPRRRTVSQQESPSPSNEYVTDGYVHDLKLEDVELRHALDALLLPLNLDYEAREGHIWISSSERIRREPSDRLEIRVYQLGNIGGETLPKVGVSNLGGPGLAGAPGGGSGNTYRGAGGRRY